MKEQRMMVTMTVAVEATKKGDEEEVAKHRLGDTGRIGDVLGEDEASQVSREGEDEDKGEKLRRNPLPRSCTKFIF